MVPLNNMASEAQIAARTAGDVTALSALAGWFVGILPSLATLVTALWFSLLIIEKLTGRSMHSILCSAWSALCYVWRYIRG
jgi:hypothetical protein